MFETLERIAAGDKAYVPMPRPPMTAQRLRYYGLATLDWTLWTANIVIATSYLYKGDDDLVPYSVALPLFLASLPIHKAQLAMKKKLDSENSP